MTTTMMKENDVLADVKNVAGFLRISTEKTDDIGKKVNIEKTLLNHKTKMLEFLKEKNWNHTLYEEVISGGKDIKERIEMTKLIEEIDQYDAIVCMELSRLSRQGLAGQRIKALVKEKGILIITLNPFKVYDIQNNPQDGFLFDLTINIGEYEKEVVSLRVKQNKIAMAKQGFNSSGSVPFGYVRNPNTKKLEIETVENEHGEKIESPKAGIVRMIYKWYLEGEGQRTICDRLNTMGILNKQGNKWVPNSLRYLLSCPTYKGTLIANNYGNKKGKQVVTEQVVVHENHPAIIDPEIWDKAQSFRDNKKKRSGVDQRSKDWNSKKHMSTLDGLIFCGCKGCGRKSTIKYYASKNNFYIIKCTRFNTDGIECTNGGRIVKDVEKTVFELLIKRKEELEARRNNFSSNDFEDRLKDLENEKSILENSLEELEREMLTITKLEIKYELDKDLKGEDKAKEQMYAELKKENDAKRLVVETELAEVNAKLQATPNAEQQIEKINQELDSITELENHRDDMTEQQVNAMLKSFILRIKYSRELPENYKSLSQAEKNKFPAKIKIKYLN